MILDACPRARTLNLRCLLFRIVLLLGCNTLLLFFDAAYLLALVPDRLVLISNVSEDTLTRGSLAVRFVDAQILRLLTFSVDFGR